YRRVGLFACAARLQERASNPHSDWHQRARHVLRTDALVYLRFPRPKRQYYYPLYWRYDPNKCALPNVSRAYYYEGDIHQTTEQIFHVCFKLEHAGNWTEWDRLSVNACTSDEAFSRFSNWWTGFSRDTCPP